MWGCTAAVSCGSSSRCWWFRCCRIKVTRQIHGLGCCCCAHEEASARLHVFLICGGYNFNLDQTKSNVLPPKWQNCTLGRRSERSERLPDSPHARGGAFPEGCFSFPCFHQGGDLHPVPVAKTFHRRRQPAKSDNLVFSLFWSSLVSETLQVCRFPSTRGVFPGRCRCIVAQEDQLVFSLIPLCSGLLSTIQYCTAIQRSNSWFAGRFFTADFCKLWMLRKVEDELVVLVKHITHLEKMKYTLLP